MVMVIECMAFYLNIIRRATLPTSLSSVFDKVHCISRTNYAGHGQITSTMMFIMKTPTRFYSELKPDNVLLSDPDKDVILIDFEQVGNWTSFSRPRNLFHRVSSSTGKVGDHTGVKKNKDMRSFWQDMCPTISESQSNLLRSSEWIP